MNTPGSFECICENGYFGDGMQCDHIDECQIRTHNCVLDHAVCINTEGSFECQCEEGYGGDATCQDVNECLEEVCDTNATCTNTIGGFSCSCKRFFRKWCSMH
eukprot:UN30341